MDSHIVEKAKNTAMLTGILVCMFAPLFDEDHDWNAPLTDQPGGPLRYTNRTRTASHMPSVHVRRNKRPREIIQTGTSDSIG